MSKYLCCVALVLCVSGAAYGNKNPAARTLTQQLKAGIQSKFGNSELAHKLANSKLARTAAAALLGFSVLCSVPGCGGDNSMTSPVAVEVVEVTELYNDERIYFTIGETFYEGYVVEGVSENEVLVLLDDRSEMVISIDRIGGTQIADHPDLETWVVMLSEQEGESIVKGKIVDVYNNDVRKIEINRVTFTDGTAEKLDTPRTRFASENADFEKEGGYLTLEEFDRWNEQ